MRGMGGLKPAYGLRRGGWFKARVRPETGVGGLKPAYGLRTGVGGLKPAYGLCTGVGGWYDGCIHTL